MTAREAFRHFQSTIVVLIAVGTLVFGLAVLQHLALRDAAHTDSGSTISQTEPGTEPEPPATTDTPITEFEPPAPDTAVTTTDEPAPPATTDERPPADYQAPTEKGYTPDTVIPAEPPVQTNPDVPVKPETTAPRPQDPPIDCDTSSTGYDC